AADEHGHPPVRAGDEVGGVVVDVLAGDGGAGQQGAVRGVFLEHLLVAGVGAVGTDKQVGGDVAGFGRVDGEAGGGRGSGGGGGGGGARRGHESNGAWVAPGAQRHPGGPRATQLDGWTLRPAAAPNLSPRLAGGNLAAVKIGRIPVRRETRSRRIWGERKSGP